MEIILEMSEEEVVKALTHCVYKKRCDGCILEDVCTDCGDCRISRKSLELIEDLQRERKMLKKRIEELENKEVR